MARSLEQLTDQYVSLDSRELSSRDGLLDIRSALSELATKVREFRAEVEGALVENIDLFGDIDMGDGKRLYVGVDKTYKCVNNVATFDALFEATGGDVTLMAEHLASGAWKPGSCRKTLADKFDTLFETAEAKDVKTGSAKRIVKAFDPAFGGGA